MQPCLDQYLSIFSMLQSGFFLRGERVRQPEEALADMLPYFLLDKARQWGMISDLGVVDMHQLLQFCGVLLMLRKTLSRG